MNAFPRLIALGLLSGLAGAAPAPPAQPRVGPLLPAPAPIVFTPCQLPHPQGLLAIAAQCGELAVPEDYAQPEGRQVRLFVARVEALSRRKQADPLVVLAGGPGLGASAFYPGIAPNLARIRRDRDILVIDQRGTGRSNPLNCPFDEQQLWDASDEDTARVMGECLKQLQTNNDVAQFTSSVAVRDLERVREALGLAQLNFYASSYGTRVAQHYARRYPGQTRAVILDGVVPPQLVLGPATPLDAQAALERVFARCREDAACHASFGDPALDYAALRAKLATETVPVHLADPRTGEPQDLPFSATVLAGALRLASYSADRAALLPLMLKLANRDGRLQPLAAQFLMTAGSYGDLLAYGMHNSIVCSEDVPLWDDSRIDRKRLNETFLGTAQLDSLRALCAGWPRGPVDADLHDELASDVPALLLSGTADPVTPAAYGREAARGFSHAVQIEVPDQGHGQIVQPCVDRVMASFLELAATPAKVARLDGSCLTALRPAPFFLTLGGPSP
jgi:pimeloyl-ACP methyl ester carboxylesterase